MCDATHFRIYKKASCTERQISNIQDGLELRIFVDYLKSRERQSTEDSTALLECFVVQPFVALHIHMTHTIVYVLVRHSVNLLGANPVRNNPRMGRDSLLPQLPDQFWSPPSPPFNDHQELLPCKKGGRSVNLITIYSRVTTELTQSLPHPSTQQLHLLYVLSPSHQL